MQSSRTRENPRQIETDIITAIDTSGFFFQSKEMNVGMQILPEPQQG